MKQALLAVLCAAGLCACAPGAPSPATETPAPASTVALDEPFELRMGQRATVTGEGVTVRFDTVASDSRCPSGVQCVWAGNALVRAVLSQGRKAFGAELNTTLEPRSVRWLDYDVALVSLAPQPPRDGAVPPSQYVATFRVTRAAP